jgi:RNA polymerase sigma-70 factor (ECF subfamily)
MQQIPWEAAYIERRHEAGPDPDGVRSAKAGDEAAFERLLRPPIDPAYRFACVMLSDPDAAEDVVQEAAVKAWRKLDQLRDGYDPQPWFLGIVANQCRSLRRTKWWSTVKIADPSGTVDASDEWVARSVDLRRAIGRLNRQQRATLTLHYYLDLPLEDVAAVTKESLAAVRSQLYRALRKMRPDLEIPKALQ